MTAEDRMAICKKCPLYKKTIFGEICNSSLWLNPETNEVSNYAKNGWIRGCNCRLVYKTHSPESHCIAKKW